MISFVENVTRSEWNLSKQKLVLRMNQEKRMMYYYSNILRNGYFYLCTAGMVCLYKKKSGDTEGVDSV